MTDERIEFIDLKAQHRRIGERMDRAILDAVHEGQFILGPKVAEFEGRLATFCGTKHVIGTANGTDALGICLMALGIRPGDAVICPAFTFAATAEAVAWLGATPIFVDIEETTYNLDPSGLPLALEAAKQVGLKPRAVIAVDLFGQTADYDAIEAFCQQYDLALICDSAQGVGAVYKGRRTGQFGLMTTASFFPAKPLGCYGDGGAIITDNDALAGLIRSLRVHGKGADKYDNVRIGMNSRLDVLQAAILLEKLAIFEDEIVARNAVAARYEAGLRELVVTPTVMEGCVSVWAQYTIRVPAERRAAIMDALESKGIPTAIYYPKPLNHQVAYRHYPVTGNGVPVSEKVASEVVALPMHPYLDAAAQDRIILELHAAINSVQG